MGCLVVFCFSRSPVTRPLLLRCIGLERDRGVGRIREVWAESFCKPYPKPICGIPEIRWCWIGFGEVVWPKIRQTFSETLSRKIWLGIILVWRRPLNGAADVSSTAENQLCLHVSLGFWPRVRFVAPGGILRTSKTNNRPHMTNSVWDEHQA